MHCDIQDIYKRYSDHLLAFIRQQIKDTTIADDLLQEIFLKTMESCIKEKDIRNLKSWLFQVTRNTIIDYFRQQNKPFHEEDYLNINHFNSSDFQQILSDDVMEMIALLPKEYGVPLLWSDIEGMPQKEIAQKLGITLPGAKSRIQRARKKLRKLFFECCDVELDAQGNIISCIIKDTCTPLLHKRK